MDVTSLNILAAVRVEFSNSTSGIFMVDFGSGKAYLLDGSEAPEDVRSAIVSEIRGQQEASMPEIPYEQIYEVINTERKIQEENNKHIFRRRD